MKIKNTFRSIKKMTKLTNERKAFLIIWIIVMAMPSMFMVGKIIEQHPYHETTVIGGVRITVNVRTWEWRDIYPFFIILAFATMTIYLMIGIEDVEKNNGSKEAKKKK